MRSARVSIILLNWNGLKDAMECLESLRQISYPDYNVVVVDNGSKGDDAEVLRNRFCDSIHLIENDRNYGWAEGNNIGIRYCLENQHPDYVLLLNNDVVMDRDFLTELVTVAEADASIGIAGPKIYFHDEPQVIQSAGGRINLRTGKFWLTGYGETDRGQYENVAEVDWVVGCTLLARREMIDRIGLIDRGYFCYYEDTDWCARCKKAGYQIVYVPGSRVWHKEAATIGRISGFKLYYMTRNRFRFMRRNANWLQLLLFYGHFSLRNSVTTATRLLFRERSLSQLRTFCEGTYDGLALPLSHRSGGVGKFS